MDHSEHMHHAGHNMAMGHEGHEGHDMPAMCSMNMIFNWQIEDTCVVFEWWHIHSKMGMIVSCLAIFAIAAGYEYLRAWTTQLDRIALPTDNKKTNPPGSTSSLSEADTLLAYPATRQRQQILRSVMYATLMGISFWLMLVFMTYNGFLMISTIFGAGVGHYIFSNRLPASRSISCH
ncbi:Ctr copper transporter family-domain-containing protein [Gongronella butleri]|nr:Ctr copper transporter family-domain-containing protein [Gongronella butleri]